MATKRPATPPPAPAAPPRPPYMLIEEIRVQGYKSLVDATLHVRPLTLLAVGRGLADRGSNAKRPAVSKQRGVSAWNRLAW